jgi:hypothetical protein
MVYMIESQLNLVVGALEHMRRFDVSTVEPRPELGQRYAREMDARSEGTVWTQGGCASWYLDGTGRNSTLWPSFSFAYRKRARFRPSEYLLTARVDKRGRSLQRVLDAPARA